MKILSKSKREVLLIIVFIFVVILSYFIFFEFQAQPLENTKSNVDPWNNQSSGVGREIYSEIFDPSIKLNLESDRYTAVFENIRTMVKIPVIYPQTLPNGYGLYEIEVHRAEEASDFLGQTFIKYRESEKEFVLSGTANLSDPEGGETVELENGSFIGIFQRFENGKEIYSSAWFVDESGSAYQYYRYQYSLYTSGLTRLEFLELANLVFDKAKIQ